jgi:hypothetical protein
MFEVKEEKFKWKYPEGLWKLRIKLYVRDPSKKPDLRVIPV